MSATLGRKGTSVVTPIPLPERQMVFGVVELAHYLCMHPQTIRRMIRYDPDLASIVGRVGNRWVVARNDLYRLAMARGWCWPPESPNGHHDAR